MALQKNAEIFRHPIAAPINSLTAVIPNKVRDLVSTNPANEKRRKLF
jgi:hypothetical protein